MVIKFIEDMNLTHRQEITETYLEALEKVKDRRGLKTRLIQGIDQKTNLKELITLFELASSLGNRVLEKQARRKLTKLYPDTPYVLRLSSEKALSKGKYDKAKRLLEKLFSQGQEDPQSLFGYAEIIRHQQGLDKAKIYYEKVIPRLKNISPKKIEFDVLEAKTLYFIGKKEESLSRCKKILSTAQKNKAIRTGMAHFLAEVGELKEAGSMLKG